MKDEIRIQHVNHEVHEILKNIAKNSGVSIQAILKPKLREIANSFPESMQRPPLKN